MHMYINISALLNYSQLCTIALATITLICILRLPLAWCLLFGSIHGYTVTGLCTHHYCRQHFISMTETCEGCIHSPVRVFSRVVSKTWVDHYLMKAVAMVMQIWINTTVPVPGVIYHSYVMKLYTTAEAWEFSSNIDCLVVFVSCVSIPLIYPDQNMPGCITKAVSMVTQRRIITTVLVLDVIYQWYVMKLIQQQGLHQFRLFGHISQQRVYPLLEVMGVPLN